MFSMTQQQDYYRALIEKNSAYEGIFFVGVKSTGIFCRPTCPARKPLFKNCEFFKTAQEALLTSYRPCQRCHPLSPLGDSKLISRLLQLVENNLAHRWKERDLEKFSIDASTARRHFKERFGITFIGYTRARRMGVAMKAIREGNSVIDAQHAAGYESGSGFREAFTRLMGTAPLHSKHQDVLHACWFQTHLGPMIAIADEKALYLLEFVDRRGLEKEIERLCKRIHLSIVPGKTAPLHSLETELKQYFDHHIWDFKTPLHLLGSPFQKRVWGELMKIPTGETRSYAELAAAIGRPSAFRAVANANGANQLAIIIPCHRVINTNGKLGGYGGGVPRKQWLINHEKRDNPE